VELNQLMKKAASTPLKAEIEAGVELNQLMKKAASTPLKAEIEAGVELNQLMKKAVSTPLRAEIKAGVELTSVSQELAELAQQAEVAAVRLQACARGYLARKRISAMTRAAVTIQISFRVYLQNKKMDPEVAAVKIQSVFRGYLFRKTMGKKLRAMYLRVELANAAATEAMTLGARTVSALQILLTHKQLTFVLRACENLQVATALSPSCCVRLVEGKAVPIMFQLVRSCNRSKPHMAVLQLALNIITNLVGE
jgi:abnormal spindle-like microcephaly-associated protein